jgi:DNA-binding MarR family transcriptional regulator
VDVARLRVAIARLGRRLRRHELAGLTPTQLSTLATVERAGPVRLSDLAAAEGIAPSTLTRLVTALEERGHLSRCPVPGDARASTVQITQAGRDALKLIREQSTIMLADRLRALSREQRAALAAALPALEQLADAEPCPPTAAEREQPRPGGPAGPAPAAAGTGEKAKRAGWTGSPGPC